MLSGNVFIKLKTKHNVGVVVLMFSVNYFFVYLLHIYLVDTVVDVIMIWFDV